MFTDEYLGGVGERARLHAVLGDSHRLAIVEDLATSDRSPSELGSRLGIGSNLLAHHLHALEDAGLIDRIESSGDGRRRYLKLRAEALSGLMAPVVRSAIEVLFVCTANSARSQLAAGLWNARHPIPATSAGTNPAERVHPHALRAGRRRGLDLEGAVPRSLPRLNRNPRRLVITVCDRAHEHLVRDSPVELLHWSIPDPALEGSAEAFDHSADQIAARVEGLAPYVAPFPDQGRSAS